MVVLNLEIMGFKLSHFYVKMMISRSRNDSMLDSGSVLQMANMLL